MEEIELLQAEAAAADREIAERNAKLLAANDPNYQQAQPVDDEAELRGIIELAAGLLAPVLPKTSEITKAQAPAMAASGAEVMRLHGWTMAGALAKYMPYIGLGMSILPVVVTARAEIAAQNAAKQQAANDDQQPQSAA